MKVCTIEGCGKPHLGRGWCSKHYERWRKYGDPLKVVQHQLHGATLLERFEANVLRSSGGCWEWTGYRDENGYGRLNINGTPVLAHRISWDLFKRRKIGEDHALHRCDNPPCVNPDHLFRGDQIANTADKMKKKRHKFGTSHGSDHGMSKLNEDQIRAILASSESPQTIAGKYDISRRHVRDIQARKVWRHLT